MVESTRQPVEVLRQPTPKPLDPGAEAFMPPVGRVLKAQSSRERSPRRTTPSPSSSNAAVVHVDGSSHAPNDIVVIAGLQSRPELANSVAPSLVSTPMVGDIVCRLRAPARRSASSLRCWCLAIFRRGSLTSRALDCLSHWTLDRAFLGRVLPLVGGGGGGLS